jgi:hypothetical protein
MHPRKMHDADCRATMFSSPHPNPDGLSKKCANCPRAARFPSVGAFASTG